MDRKSLSVSALKGLFSGIVIPVLLAAIKAPLAVIVAAAAGSMAVIFLWGHSAEGINWRKRVVPVLGMVAGAGLFLVSALWFYTQKPTVPRHPDQSAKQSPPSLPTTASNTPSPAITPATASTSPVTDSAGEARAKALPARRSEVPGVRHGETAHTQPFNDTEARATVLGLWRVWLDRDGLTTEEVAGLVLPPDAWMNDRLEKMGRGYRVRANGSQFDILSLGPTDGAASKDAPQ